MSVFLAIVIALLLLGAAVIGLNTRLQRGHPYHLASIVVGLVLLVWLFAGRSLPLTFTVTAWPDFAQPSPWDWHVDAPAWRLSFYLLLLGLAVLTTALVRLSSFGLDAASAAELEPPNPDSAPLAILILLLLAAALLTLWSSAIPSLLAGWTLLSACWLLLLMRASHAELNGRFWRFGLLSVALIFLAFAAAEAPVSALIDLDNGNWPARARIWAFLAAGLQIGVFPFYIWRPTRSKLGVTPAVFIALLPAASGALLLFRLAEMPGTLGAGSVALGTVVGLLGLLTAVTRAWQHLDRPLQAAAAVTIGQASLLYLAAVWGSGAAVLAEARVLFLAVGGLFILSAWSRPRPAWILLGPWLGLAALAGLPLTAGFTGRAALYGIWIAEGRHLLLLATTLLTIPLLAAMLITFGQRPLANHWPGDRRLSVIGLLASSLLFFGLLSRPASALTEIQPLTWAAILVQLAGGAILSRFADRVREAPEALHEAFRLRWPAQALRQAAASLGAALSSAGRQAAGILEGERGLMWMALLLVIVWLALRG